MPDEPNQNALIPKVRRHVEWARTEGVRKLIEEDQLDPVERARNATTKAVWRWRYGVPQGFARAVFVVGVQRSGTNMVMRGLEQAPEFEVHNENDTSLFKDFLLRSDERLQRTVLRSHHRYVLVKPLCESHRVVELLDDLGTPVPPRALWVYRDVDPRVRSAVSKFGDANLRALTRIAAGDDRGMWQAGGLSDENRGLVASVDWAEASPETAAALFWYVRNSLFFELGLDRRPDVLPVKYEHLVADPAWTMKAICEFLAVPFRPALVAHIDARAAKPLRLPIDERVRARCDELTARLDDAARAARLGLVAA